MRSKSYQTKINTKNKEFYFKIKEDYYKIVSGDIFLEFGDYHAGYNITAKKLKCVLKQSNVIPIDQFKDKRFFHEDVFEYVIDDEDDQIHSFKNKVVFNIVELTKQHLIRSVLYVEEKDKNKNFNKKEFFRVIQTDKVI